jgi:hypothetical protein
MSWNPPDGYVKRFSYGLLSLLLISVCILLIVTGVRRAPNSNVNVVVAHPTPQNIPDASVILTKEGDSAYDSSYWSSTRPITQIGVDERPKHAMLGVIESVSMDANRNIFILDYEYSTVRIYNESGDYLSSFASEGDGPGEIWYPESIDLSEGDSLAVIVGSEPRITMYRRSDSPDSLEYVFENSFFQVNGAISRAGCAMNGHIYVLAYGSEQEGVIFKYDLTGRFIRSFGDKYRDPEPFVRQSLSRRGFLACSDKHDTVAWIRRSIPVVHVYTGNGELLVRYKLQDFTPSVVTQRRTEDGRPSLRFEALKEGESRFANLFADDDGAFIVSYATAAGSTSIQGAPPPIDYHVYRLASHLGEETYLGSIPNIVAMSEGKIVLEAESPYPQVLLYEVRRNK